ncbi:MAG: hypothetical protein AABP62_12515 [Planctomycetota bacterium]
MSFGHCSCPDCGTTLRIRDRTFVGRTVPCPECHASLVIELDREERFVARKPPVDTSVKSSQAAPANRSAVKSDGPREPTWTDGLRGAIGSPLVMAWALGLAVTALVIVAMLRPALRFSSPGGSTQSEAANNTIAPDETNSGNDASLQPSPELPSPKELPDSPMADAIKPTNAPELPVPSPAPPQPGDGGPVIKPVTAVAVKPADPLPPAPPPKIDFVTVLKQPLLLFDQAKPVSRRELIELMEELVGAPIRYDAAELGENNLDKQVTFKAENTTLGGVLKSLLDPAGWVFVEEETQLRLKLKPPE